MGQRNTGHVALNGGGPVRPAFAPPPIEATARAPVRARPSGADTITEEVAARARNAAVFAPIGVGRPVDHLLARTQVDALFPSARDVLRPGVLTAPPVTLGG